jgi:hypothetical protein
MSDNTKPSTVLHLYSTDYPTVQALCKAAIAGSLGRGGVTAHIYPRTHREANDICIELGRSRGSTHGGRYLPKQYGGFRPGTDLRTLRDGAAYEWRALVGSPPSHLLSNPNLTKETT